MRYFIFFVFCLSVIIFPKETFAKSELNDCAIKNNQLDFSICDKNLYTCHCKAKLDLGDGRVYDGEWYMNQTVGKGTMTYENGRKYVGEWKYIGTDQLGKGQIFYEDGLHYIGEWAVDGLRHGQGTMVDKNGNTYSGNWWNNKRHGQGQMIYVDGFQYIGNWENNEPSAGQTTLIYSNGTTISAYLSYGMFGYGFYKINSILDLRGFLFFWYYKINNQR